MSNTPPTLFAVVLAAGSASRFGETKQLASLNGETLVHRAARHARAVCGQRSILVVGHDARAVTASADGECEYLLVNDRHTEGLGTSLALAARALAGVADAFLLLLADQPMITSEHLDSLAAAWSGDLNTIVATAYADTAGAPALLPSGSFQKLGQLSGDVGARTLFGDPDFDLIEAPFDGAAHDVDTPADLDALIR